jgi:hypothetical protein
VRVSGAPDELVELLELLSDNHLGRSAATILAGGEGLIRSRA